MCLNSSYLSLIIGIIVCGLIKHPNYFDAYSKTILLAMFLAQIFKMVESALRYASWHDYGKIASILVFSFNALFFLILDVFVFRLLMIKVMLDTITLEQTKREIRIIKRVTVFFFVVMLAWCLAISALLWQIH